MLVLVEVFKLYRKWVVGSLVVLGLLFSSPGSVAASEYGLTDAQQKKIVEPYDRFYHAAFADKAAVEDFGMYKIPGLYEAATLSLATGKIAESQTMTPQGIALTDKYVLISAYSHDHQNHSVIYMLDRQTHRYLKTVVLPGHPHLGGIAYDPKHQRVWVTTDGLYAGLASIDLKVMEDYQLEDQRVVAYHQQISLNNIARASALTYTSGVLVVGYFTLDEYGRMSTYRLNDQGELTTTSQEKVSSFDAGQPNKATQLPVAPPQFARSIGAWKTLAMVQGIAFYKDYLLMSQSWGPERSGKIYFFNLDKVDRYFSIKDAEFKVDTPPYIEQITVSDNQLFTLFEGAAFPYRRRNPVLVDHAIQLRMDDLLEKTDE